MISVAILAGLDGEVKRGAYTAVSGSQAGVDLREHICEMVRATSGSQGDGIVNQDVGRSTPI